MWALYKEVQGYYDGGMRVPDDVTLLWSDDNWGNIRRLPTPEERKRSGGAGVYYHFDYVGGPRNYKWINTNPIPKVWEQMNLALEYGADRIWIVNVGDLKPMEFPIDFFLNFARDPKRWPKEKLGEFTRLWAEREFGGAHAAEIADLVSKTLKYNARRKPELLEPATYSITDYDEADRVVAEYKDVIARAEKHLGGSAGECARCVLPTRHPSGEGSGAGHGALHRGREESLVRRAGPRQRQRLGRQNEGALPGRHRSDQLLQQDSGRRQVEPHDGPDPHRLHLLAGADE